MSRQTLEESFEEALRSKLEKRDLAGLWYQQVCTEPGFSTLINVELRFSALGSRRRDIFERVFNQVQADQSTSHTQTGMEPVVAA